jgi:hypothetical protein
MLFKSRRAARLKKRSRRQPAPGSSSHRVISYYTASRRQLDNFERQSGLSAKSRQLNKHLRFIGKWWFWGLTVIAALAIMAYLLSLGSQPHIDIDSTSYRSLAEYQAIIEPELKKDWHNRLKPLLQSDQLQQSLQQLLPEAATISVTSSWFGHSPIVKITTHLPMAVFSQKGQPDRLISARGKILITVEQSDVMTNDLPLLQNATGLEAPEGEQFMRPDEAEAFSRLVTQFKTENAVVTYNLPSTPHELMVAEAGRGYQVKFLLNDQIVRQFGALRATEKKLAEIGQVPQSYIDVRLADKAFYQ